MGGVLITSSRGRIYLRLHPWLLMFQIASACGLINRVSTLKPWLQTCHYNPSLKNGWPMDSVRSDLSIDWVYPWISRHVFWSFAFLKKNLILSYVIITRDIVHPPTWGSDFFLVPRRCKYLSWALFMFSKRTTVHAVLGVTIARVNVVQIVQIWPAKNRSCPIKNLFDQTNFVSVLFLDWWERALLKCC